jgi:hypothetical protein
VLTSVQARWQEIREGAGTVGVEGIEDFEIDAVRDPAATPSDAFQIIVQSNRQVNRMLVRPLQPGGVYQQVSQTTLYASEILAALGDATPFPGAPAYEPGLTPGHVYGRLLLVFDRLCTTWPHCCRPSRSISTPESTVRGHPCWSRIPACVGRVTCTSGPVS